MSMAAKEVIAWFADIGLEERSRVGGKGGSLGELQRPGIAVPPGFVIKTGAFERFIAALERKAPLRSRINALSGDDLSATAARCAEIRARIEAEALPPEVVDELTSAYSALCGLSVGDIGSASAGGDGPSPVAVRSSATTEDAADASFAGLQDTYLWVADLNQTVQRVRSCWASLYSVESVTYR